MYYRSGTDGMVLYRRWVDTMSSLTRWQHFS